MLRHVEAEAPVPVDVAERGELRQSVLRALDRLSPALREAFVLRHIEDHSFEEIAALLGTGVSAVKMRVHRARLQLQESLAPEAVRSGEPDGLPATDVTGSPGDSSEALESDSTFIVGRTSRKNP